jgi:hypothetical protein
LATNELRTEFPASLDKGCGAGPSVTPVKEQLMKSSATYDLPIFFWIALAVLGFVLFWPLGVMILIYMMWSGKMKCRNGIFTSSDSNNRRCCGIRFDVPRSSGNMAFDEYREATLKRLDQEQREFADFLKQLRHAKDQEQFDKYMSERAAGQSQASTSK